MVRLDLSAVDARVALLQALIPIALDHVGELLAEEMASLAGHRYARHDGAPSRVQWGQQRASIYLGHQKVGIAVPRVRDRATNTEVGLQTYAALQQPRAIDQARIEAILGDVSTREYGRCVGLIPSAFGLSGSTISRRFQQASRRRLRALHERWLGGEQVVAVVLDGKTFAADAVVVAVGVWVTVFGAHGVVQRCQWHKRENVVRYLPPQRQRGIRRKLQAAYDSQPMSGRRKRSSLSGPRSRCSTCRPRVVSTKVSRKP